MMPTEAQKLSKANYMWLHRRQCKWCDQYADRLVCGAIYHPRCTEEFLLKRRSRWLREAGRVDAD